MRIVAILVLLLCLGCESPYECDPRITAPCTERPTVNLPHALRQRNWNNKWELLRDKNGKLVWVPDGSCAHATMVSLLRWQGRPELAAWWRRNNAGGEWSSGESLAEKLNRAGVRFAYTARKKDIKFLEWACNTRRGCGVCINGGEHMVALVHLDSKWAALLDNNDTQQFIWVPRETLIAEWINSGSWAVCPVYTPAPPLPRK